MQLGLISWIRTDLLPIITTTLENSDVYEILALGSGNGESDCIFLHQLTKFLTERNLSTRIKYTVVEQNEEQIHAFQTNTCRSVIESYPNITFEWHTTSKEKFLEDHHGKKFNLVYFSRPFYDNDDCKKTFSHLLDNYWDIGAIVSTYFRDGIFTSLAQKYSLVDIDNNPKKAEINTVAGFDLRGFIEKYYCNGMEFINMVDIDVTEVVNGSNEAKGKLRDLLSFQDAKVKFPEDDMEKIISEFKEAVSGQMIVEDVTRSYITQRCDVLIIWKE